MSRKKLTEELAAIEHRRWAHWQQYLHEQCERLSDGRLAIPRALAERWEIQIHTPYEQLSEKEKQSDRDQVQKSLLVLEKYLSGNDH